MAFQAIARLEPELSTADAAILVGDLTNFGDPPDAFRVIEAARALCPNVLAVTGNPTAVHGLPLRIARAGGPERSRPGRSKSMPGHAHCYFRGAIMASMPPRDRSCVRAVGSLPNERFHVGAQRLQGAPGCRRGVRTRAGGRPRR